MVLVPRRAVLFVATGVLVVLGLTALAGAFGSGGGAAGPGSSPTPITIEADSPGRRVPFGFLGLSLEYPAVEAYAGTDPLALDPVFQRLVRNLVPDQALVLRIGGDSTDRTWWPTPGLARPPGIKFAITPRWLAVTRALAGALRARLVLGLNLEADDPALAASEASALLDGIGSPRVRAFELGNEPDLYASFPWYRTPEGQHITGRASDYGVTSLIGDWTRFAAALPRRGLAGPSLGAPGWTRELGRFLTAERHVRLVTLHRYPLQLCFTSRRSSRYPTVAHLLAPSSSIGLADSFAPYAAIARAHGLSLRIDEWGSVSCGADPAVSDTFASALWALDTLFEMVRDGIHGVNVHTFPGAGYELFRIGRATGRWQAVVAPEYYGLLLFARAAPAGSRLLRVSGAGSGAVRTWATRARGGTIRVVLVNSGGRLRRLALRVTGARVGRAILERLSAADARARSGVSLGGQSFGSRTFTGALPGSPRTIALAPVHGRYAVTLPAASAAMLVLPAPS
ncbi:MAG TPA: glycosyl hydrolase family 79 C-terminal domain-containing protein [Thermoleophilaceae bacterium]|nr:glycosyl hydrolase family 79 C-terminal domain-containing protein [Thermoleophilaceae bacterium]